jgi:hypothetical protein
MYNYFGLTHEHATAISDIYNIPELSLYMHSVETISEVYQIPLKHLHEIIKRCDENEEKHEI